MNGYDFSLIDGPGLAALRTEQHDLLSNLHGALRDATDIDEIATLEGEALSGFELLAAIDAEIAGCK